MKGFVGFSIFVLAIGSIWVGVTIGRFCLKEGKTEYKMPKIETSLDCEYACELKGYDYFGYDKFADDLKCVCSKNGTLKVVE